MRRDDLVTLVVDEAIESIRCELRPVYPRSRRPNRIAGAPPPSRRAEPHRTGLPERWPSPRYDWVGDFSDKRAAVRSGGLYGFVDDEGHEVAAPQYGLVDDYKFGFAQVEVGGKSGLIDRDGKMIFAPTYGFIEAIGPDRFRVSDFPRMRRNHRRRDFSGIRTTYTSNSVSVSAPFEFKTNGVIDLSGQWIEPAAPPSREFDKTSPSVRWVERGGLWGLLQADGSWLVEPKFQRAEALSDGLARVTLAGARLASLMAQGNSPSSPSSTRPGRSGSALGAHRQNETDLRHE